MVTAHGIGGRSDLPVPLWLAVYGGTAAVVVSFVVLSLLWSSERFGDGDHGRALPAPVQRVLDSPLLHLAARLLGLVAGAALLGACWFGSNDPAANPASTWFYVWLWVGLLPASVALGPVLRRLSPLRTIAELLGGGFDRRPIPGRLGTVVAVGGLLVFLWLELVDDRGSEPRTIGIFLTAYAVVHALGGVWFGPSWFGRAESFEVYSTLVGHLSCLARRQDGRWVLRSPFRGLASIGAAPELVPITCVLLGSTAFDGLSRSAEWRDLAAGAGTRTAYLLLGSVGLAAAILAVTCLYLGAIALTRPYVRRGTPLAGLFVHSLVPIVCGYTVAHYFSFAVYQGQAGIFLASDPLGRGWDLLGMSGRTIDYTVVSTRTIALVQVGAIVAGHVVGVIAAHDRAVGLFRARSARSGQYPLLAVMIGFTMAGIALVVGS